MTINERFLFPSVAQPDGFSGQNINNQALEGFLDRLVDSINALETRIAELEASSGGGGSSTFLGLTDTPSAYSGSGGQSVRVNAGATALEFFTPASATYTEDAFVRQFNGGGSDTQNFSTTASTFQPDTTIYNTLGSDITYSSGEVTFNISGTFEIEWWLLQSTLTTSPRWICDLQLDTGSGFASTGDAAGDGGTGTIAGNMAKRYLTVSSGDKIRFRARALSSGNFVVRGNSGFSIRRVP